MWDARLFKAMARLAAPEATIATWSAARAAFATRAAPASRSRTRRAARQARHHARTHFARTSRRGRRQGVGRPRSRHAAAPATGSARPVRDATADALTSVVIVGARLAGCALARALAERGIRSLVIERGAAVAEGGSGNAAGLFHGIVHPGDGGRTRAFIAPRPRRRRCRTRGDPAARRARRHRGIARVETRRDLAEMQRLIDAQGLPADYVEALDRDAASRLAGARLSSPAWHFPGAGWVDPRGLARSWLTDASASVRLRLDCAALSLQRIDAGWALHDHAGATIAAAPVVVLCNGDGAGAP